MHVSLAKPLCKIIFRVTIIVDRINKIRQFNKYLFKNKATQILI